jgi:hypothetical protein
MRAVVWRSWLCAVCLLSCTRASYFGASASPPAVAGLRTDAPSQSSDEAPSMPVSFHPGAQGVVDEDEDGVPDGLEEEVARNYFPFYSLAAQDRCPLHGVLYRISPHPARPDLLVVRYDVLYQHDCGLRGHVGDSELFATLVDPSVPAPHGILAVRSVSHRGTACESVMTCGSMPGCHPCTTALRQGAPFPVVFASLNKHGSYLSEVVCSYSFLCDFGGCSLQRVADDPPMVNAGEPGRPLVDDLSRAGFIRADQGWQEPALTEFDPWRGRKFAAGGSTTKALTDPIYVIQPSRCEP